MNHDCYEGRNDEYLRHYIVMFLSNYTSIAGKDEPKMELYPYNNTSYGVVVKNP